MNIGLLGGTFDPIHLGHIALAQAASQKFSLHRVLFVPANNPPHKQKQSISDFSHRYAMVALGTEQEKTFVPSLLEAPGQSVPVSEKNKAGYGPRPSYTIDTVRQLKQKLRKSDSLFLLIGIDAFLDIGKWYLAADLLKECEFIVASRPGYSLADVANALPEKVRPAANVTRPFHKQPAVGDLVLPGAHVRLLDGLKQDISSSAIRQAAASGKWRAKELHPSVMAYIKKQGLYLAKES